MCKYGLPTSRLSEVIARLTDIHTDRQTDRVHSLRRGTDISVELLPLVVLAVVYHLGHFKNLRLLD